MAAEAKGSQVVFLEEVAEEHPLEEVAEVVPHEGAEEEQVVVAALEEQVARVEQVAQGEEVPVVAAAAVAETLLVTLTRVENVAVRTMMTTLMMILTRSRNWTPFPKEEDLVRSRENLGEAELAGAASSLE